MQIRDVAVKVAVGAITTMAAGIGSILGTEGAKAGLKAIMNRPRPDNDLIPDLPEPIDIPIDAADIPTEADVDILEETVVMEEVDIPEDGA